MDPPMHPVDLIVVSDNALFCRTFGKLAGTLSRAVDVSLARPGDTLVSTSNEVLLVLDCGTADATSALGRVEAAGEQLPGARIACVFDEQDDVVIARVIEAGAAGVLVKASAPLALVASLEALLAGQICRPAPVQTLTPQDVPEHLRARLSARQQKLLRLLMGGESVSSISDRLELTPARVVHESRRVMDIVRGRD